MVKINKKKNFQLGLHLEFFFLAAPATRAGGEIAAADSHSQDQDQDQAGDDD